MKKKAAPIRVSTEIPLPKPILHAVYIGDHEKTLKHGQIFCMPGQPCLKDATGDHEHKSIALRKGLPIPVGHDIVDL